MRIRILSDLHLEHHAPPDGLGAGAARADGDSGGAEVVVLAGDVARGPRAVRWARRAFPDVPVVCVAGNHEHYDRLLDTTTGALRAESDPLPGPGSRPTGTYVLEREAAWVGNVRFLGCTFWTGFRLFAGRRAQAMAACRAQMDDYRRIHLLRERRPLRPRDTDRRHRRAVAWLRQACGGTSAPRPGATVVVTHHAPTPRSVDPRYENALTSAAFAARRAALVRESSAALWVHGHVHAAFDYRVGETRVVANPRGHPGENPAFDPGFTVEV